MEEEIWKDITNYEGHYQISSYGNVKSLKRSKEKLLKPILSSSDYYQVVFIKEKIRRIFCIHSLVAQLFLGHVPNKHELVIDHIDDNKLNNNVNNLRILTNYENRFKNHSLIKTRRKGTNFDKRYQKWRACITLNKKSIHIGYFKTEDEAGNAYDKYIKTLNK